MRSLAVGCVCSLSLGAIMSAGADEVSIGADSLLMTKEDGAVIVAETKVNDQV